HKNKGSYVDKLIASIKAPYLKSVQRMGLLERLHVSQYWDHITIVIILMLIIIGYAVYELGELEAKRQEWFYVITQPSPPELAVIRNYGDYLYAVPFNRNTKEFEKKVVVIKMSESSKPPLILSLEKIGRLKEMSSKALPENK